MMNPIMSDATTLALGWSLLHFIWQGAAVAAILGLVQTVVRRPQARHAVGVCALAACALLPAATFLLALPSGGAPEAHNLVTEASSSAQKAAPRAPLQRSVVPPTQPTDVGVEAGTTMSLMSLRSYVPVTVLLWVVGGSSPIFS